MLPIWIRRAWMCGIRIEIALCQHQHRWNRQFWAYENKEEDEAESHVYANHQILIKEAISSEELVILWGWKCLRHTILYRTITSRDSSSLSLSHGRAENYHGEYVSVAYLASPIHYNVISQHGTFEASMKNLINVY